MHITRRLFPSILVLLAFAFFMPWLSVRVAAQSATSSATLNIFEGPTSADFAALNPMVIAESPFVDDFSSPAGIINRALLFAFPLAGLILFVMIVWGGLEMITGATNKKSMEQARQRITSALIGFFLLFASFWIIQIVEYIFNVAIL